MRKFAAISLMVILLINTCGYRLIISALQQQSDRQFDASLDNNEYDESQLIEFSVPLNMPYQERFTDFERHYGQIEIEGRSYTYVKRKIAGDVVIFKCIANQSKDQLKKIDADMTMANAANNTDRDHSEKQQSSFAKNLFSDFDDQFAHYDLNSASAQKSLIGDYTIYFPQTTVNTPHQPPEMV